MKRRLIITMALLAAVASPAAAYKQIVHRIITGHAFDRALPHLDLQTHLGFHPDTKFEGRTAKEWTEQGADDEDNGTNSLSHFYDPRHDAPLTVQPFCTAVGDATTAPDRAILGSSISEASIAAVNEHYLSAILGSTELQRKSAAKRLFLTLGHVVHLLEDMAQPEHTRNDQHLFPLIGTAPASIYEEWGLLHLLGNSPAVSYEGHPTMRFPRYRDYWHTDDLTMGFPTGRGLADFSNNNFLTQDTNYHDTTGKCFYYNLPMRPLDPAAVRVETKNEQVWIGGILAVIPVQSEIYTSSITDYATNVTDSDVYHTFYSSLDQETRIPGTHVYSLGDGSYLTRASMLIPRAVGYSAGLMERVFRGRIAVKWTAAAEPGQYDMEIINQSAEAIGADAKLYADYRHKDPSTLTDLYTIKRDNLSDLIPGFSGIAAGGSVTVQNLVPATGLPQGKTLDDLEKHIAIEATLGTGKAVIGLVQPPSGKPLFVRMQTYKIAYPNTPPPMPPTTQLRVYIAVPGEATLRRVDGTWASDGDSITLSTRIPDGASYRILTFHQTPMDRRLAPHAYLVSAAEDEQYIDDVFSPHFIDQYGIGMHEEQYGVSQCLPLSLTAPPILTPPGYNIANQYRGACGVQFYLAGNPFTP